MMTKRTWSMQELSVKLPLPNECSKNTLINT